MPRLRPTAPVSENFERLLPRLLRRYFRRGHRLVRQQASSEALHRFRIRTKRIRYITELYEEVFPLPLRGSLKQFRGVQDVLGLLQDQRMFQGWLMQRINRSGVPASRVEYRRLWQLARARELLLRQEFFQHWKKLEDSGFERRLTARIKSVNQASRPIRRRRPSPAQPRRVKRFHT